MRLLQRAESPLYIHVQEARVSGRELTSSLLASAKSVVAQLTSAKRCREAGFGEVDATKLASAKLGVTKWAKS
jgi:hypothetical protein